MKKVILLLFLSVIVAGCSISPEESEYNPNVVQIQEFEGVMDRVYDSVLDLSEYSDAIVIGNICDSESFVTKNGIIWTKETIEVIDVLKGKDISNRINVYCMGGQATVSEYIDSFSSSMQAVKQDQYKAFNKQDYIKQLHGERELGVTGDNELYFLRSTDTFGESVNSYETVGVHLGIFKAGGIDTYVQNTIELNTKSDLNATDSNANKATDSNAATSIDNLEDKNITFDGILGQYTYDELVDLIN